ncbi:hypothetical protein F5J12DRAFT_783912 [Pisolithus orientalis]|uniref:uncharacterized protein n=1 Tax=Pisolithus orientalis TaxID=936130 RepID=UPI002224BB0D|nr:uncharacterized protein F5J12DRAFT_783912 [Pisolithus orientalis]KAI6002447.1 hypothetical protein F5J12DRAFT_783912 [Pisolithus orientalis]
MGNDHQGMSEGHFVPDELPVSSIELDVLGSNEFLEGPPTSEPFTAHESKGPLSVAGNSRIIYIVQWWDKTAYSGGLELNISRWSKNKMTGVAPMTCQVGKGTLTRGQFYQTGHPWVVLQVHTGPVYSEQSEWGLCWPVPPSENWTNVLLNLCYLVQSMPSIPYSCCTHYEYYPLLIMLDPAPNLWPILTLRTWKWHLCEADSDEKTLEAGDHPQLPSQGDAHQNQMDDHMHLDKVADQQDADEHKSFNMLFFFKMLMTGLEIFMVTMGLEIFVVTTVMEMFVAMMGLEMFMVMMGLEIFMVMMGLEIFIMTTVLEIHGITTHPLDMMTTIHLLHLSVPPSWTLISRNSFVTHAYQRYGMACTS